MLVLNCVVPDALWARWEAFFSPAAQPFFVSDALAARVPGLLRWSRSEFRALGVPLTLTDTLSPYGVSRDAPWVLTLTEHAFRSLPAKVQGEVLLEQVRHGRGGVERVET